MNACSESVSPMMFRRRKSGRAARTFGFTRSNASMVPSCAKSQRRNRKGWVFSSFAYPKTAWRAWTSSASESTFPTRSASESAAVTPEGRFPRRTLPPE